MSRTRHARRPRADVYRYWIMRVAEPATSPIWTKRHDPVGKPIHDKLEAISKAKDLVAKTGVAHDVLEGRDEPLMIVASFSPGGHGDYIHNPASGAAAAAKFREFHRKEPRRTGAFHDELVIPSHAWKLGDGVHVLYRSDKVDPESGLQPKRPLDYIHEHDSWGVETFIPRRPGRARAKESVAVPAFVREAQELVLLGICLGIAYRPSSDGIVELNARTPYPELYTTPCGRALLVISGKRELDYLVWGGGLGVEDVGIVG